MALTLALVGAGPVLATVASAAADLRCGSTVTTNVVLDRDLLDCPLDGLVVGAHNITLDLNGHTIDGKGAVGSAGIKNVGHTGLTVKNGVIREFERGIVFRDADSNRVVNNAVAINVEDGIFADALSNGTVIQGNRVTQNGATPPGQRPTPAAEWGDGIDVRGPGAWITQNTVDKNKDDGIDANGSGVRIENNTTTDNGPGSRSADGIDVDGVGPLIAKNTATGNGDDGIGIGLHAQRPVIRGNTANGNRDLGIQASTARAVDGGGNRARGNGDGRQCVGVTCN